VQVTDSKAHILASRENAETGKLAFTTEDYDVFEICLVSAVPQSEFVSIHVLTY